MKLNVGCGQYPIREPGWINLDRLPYGDIVCKVVDTLPFKSNVFDEIYAGHFIEHLSIDNAISFLKECHRCLKLNSRLVITIPDYIKIFQQFDFIEANRMITSSFPKLTPFGFDNDQHWSIWDVSNLIKVMNNTGFRNVREIPDYPHLVARVGWQSIVEGYK